jgi:hypothetical protein
MDKEVVSGSEASRLRLFGAWRELGESKHWSWEYENWASKDDLG